jgi:hypothetical protein
MKHSLASYFGLSLILLGTARPLLATTNGEAASYVLGQPDFVSCNFCNDRRRPLPRLRWTILMAYH